MNNFLRFAILFSIIIPFLISCGSTRKFKNTIPAGDTTLIDVSSSGDLLLQKVATETFDQVSNNAIEYTTFSAKIRIRYQDKYGAQPDGNAVLRLYKDSAIWISLSGSILNVEAFRLLITPDSIIILNKLDKTVEKHPFGFIENLAHMPLNFSVLQDLIVGIPVYLGDSLKGFRNLDQQILLATIGPMFKNTLTLRQPDKKVEKSKLEPIHSDRDRIIHLFYQNYQAGEQGLFPLSREIMIEDDSEVKISMTFREYEFNKELSVSMNIPSNYKTK